MKNTGDADNLTALLRDLEVRLQRQERHTHIFPPAPPVTIVIPAPEPPPPVGCEPFCDEFTGASLGSIWAEGPAFDPFTFTPVIENAVSGGAFVCGENDHPAPEMVEGSIMSVADFPAGPQFAEVVTGNWFQGHPPSMTAAYQWVEGEFWLFTQLQPDGTCLGAYCIIHASPGAPVDTEAYAQLIRCDATGDLTYYGDGWVKPLASDWETNHSYTYRLETDETGHCQVSVDGTVVVTDDLPPVAGDGRVGVAMRWNRTNYDGSLPTNPGVSPRIESFCGGCLL